jgi:PAS domain S-box-containing protein
MVSKALKKINLLIVEDDPWQVFLISETLDQAKFEISTIQDGQEACKHLLNCETPPDLIMLDYHLPSMNGLQIMNTLHSNNRKYNIVFLTADYSVDTAIKSINAGALEFIPKDSRFVTNIPAIMDKAYDVVVNKLEKEQFEKALQDSEERFKRVLEATRDGIFEWNKVTGEMYLSATNANMLGYEPANLSLTYMDWCNLMHHDDILTLNEKFQEHLIKNSNLYEAEIRVKTKSGEYKWLLERAIVIEKDNAGNAIRVIGIHSDISERKAAEEKIIEANRKLTMLIGNLPGAVYRSPHHDFFSKEFVSERIYDITGYTADTFIQQNTLDYKNIVHPNDLASIYEKIHEAVTKQSAYDMYYRIYNKNGNIMWIWDHGNCVINSSKEVVALEGYMADITDRKKNEEALIQSEEEKKIILDNSLQSLILLNSEGKVITFNRTANHRAILMSGKSIRKGQPVFDYVPDNEKESFHDSFEKVIKGEPCYWEFPFFRHNLSWYENVMVPIFVSKDEVKFICYTSTDITERKQSEEKIIYSENLYNTAINSIIDTIFVIDQELKILLTNQALIKFNKRFGFPENIIGKKITDIYPFITTKVVENYNTVFNSGIEITLEESYIIKERLFYYETRISPVVQQNKVVRVVISIRDITERKHFEKRIMHAIIETEEKERKRFSEDLHDELGSLLSTIKIYINTLHREEIDVTKRGEMVDFTNELINQAIQNSKEIANNLSPNVIKRFGLVSAVQSFCEKIEISEQLHIIFSSDKFTHKLKEEEEISIYRVITELINNTIKHAEASTINISIESRDKTVVIVYNDNGKGFDFEEVLQKKRKGLGLQNIVTRINSLNGSYTVQNVAQQGFSISIELML